MEATLRPVFTQDLAVMLARLYTGRWPIVALRNGYHGMTGGTQGLTAVGFYKHQVPAGFGVEHLAVLKVYNPRLGPEASVEDIVRYHLNDLDDHLDSCMSDGQVAAFIAESTQGVGGVVTLPPGYLQGVYDRIRSVGGICIADEVQTGFGRTGTNFWGFQNHGVVPDVVTMAKSIGNGMPLAAVAAREDIMNELGRKAFFVSGGLLHLCPLLKGASANARGWYLYLRTPMGAALCKRQWDGKCFGSSTMRNSWTIAEMSAVIS
ncbi:alanine--glyoxylate aminotransferase 2 [Perkinsus olseni]|uniref:alanine--glyoxylate transaminase n=1 Tax=Perkinsus olseni TaxID=32597 RepID=A0A7J6T209_PEROL|nr:alanine--glyoxylate aminotransferase 2 [Perkinsus olseni]